MVSVRSSFQLLYYPPWIKSVSGTDLVTVRQKLERPQQQAPHTRRRCLPLPQQRCCRLHLLFDDLF